MKNLLFVLILALPIFAQAATTTSTPATSTAMGMLAQLPTFLIKLDTLRGKALTVTEKAAVTDVVKQGNTSINNIQSTFIGGISKASGLDTATLGVLFPSATKPVSTSNLTTQLETRLGKKLGFVQKTGVTAANTLRNNSLDGLKTTMTNGVSKQLGMDPALVSSLLPLLGF